MPVKIGILFPMSFDDPGEYLADARAFEAAGADQIWVEPAEDAHPLVVLAAIAAVTGRVGLGVVAASVAQADAIVSDPQLRTVQRLARGRATIGVRAGDGVTVGDERWVMVEVPADREAWQRTLETAMGTGASGVLMPADARLIDLLRNPIDEGDRRDLQVGMG